jgi:hypothetical protein
MLLDHAKDIDHLGTDLIGYKTPEEVFSEGKVDKQSTTHYREVVQNRKFVITGYKERLRVNKIIDLWSPTDPFVNGVKVIFSNYEGDEYSLSTIEDNSLEQTEYIFSKPLTSVAPYIGRPQYFRKPEYEVIQPAMQVDDQVIGLYKPCQEKEGRCKHFRALREDYFIT